MALTCGHECSLFAGNSLLVHVDFFEIAVCAQQCESDVLKLLPEWGLVGGSARDEDENAGDAF